MSTTILHQASSNGELNSVVRNFVAGGSRSITIGISRATNVAGTGSLGGFTVNEKQAKSIQEAITDHSAMMEFGTVFKTAKGGNLIVVGVDDTSETGDWLAEDAEHTEKAISGFSKSPLGGHICSSGRIVVSRELAQDSPDISGIVLRAVAGRIGRTANAAFTSGDGSGEPRGLLMDATDSGLTGLSFDNVSELLLKIPSAYRSSESFCFSGSEATLLELAKLTDASGRQPLVQFRTQSDSHDMVLGKRFVVNNDLPDPAPGAKCLVCGDLSKYVIRQIQEITLNRFNERFIENGLACFIATVRLDGRLVDPSALAVQYLTIAP